MNKELEELIGLKAIMKFRLDSLKSMVEYTENEETYHNYIAGQNSIRRSEIKALNTYIKLIDELVKSIDCKGGE